MPVKPSMLDKSAEIYSSLLPKSYRLPSYLIPKVLQTGNKYYCKLFTMLVLENKYLAAASPSRFAVIISAKALKHAVDRNKIKRRYYSLISNHTRYIKYNYNVIYLVKRISFYANYKSIATEIYNSFKISGLLTKTH